MSQVDGVCGSLVQDLLSLSGFTSRLRGKVGYRYAVTGMCQAVKRKGGGEGGPGGTADG